MTIKTPFVQAVRYDADNHRLLCGRDIIGTFTPAVGQYLALCINEHERLTARVAELESQVELWSGEAGDNLRNGAELIKGLRQENERYRAALVKIRSPHESDPPPDVIARTALKEEKDEK